MATSAKKTAEKKTGAKKAAPKKAIHPKPAGKKADSKKSNAKSASATSETGIKYSDKSAGQPQLVPIFEAIKKLLLPYAKGAMKVRGGTGGQMVLINEKPVEIDGKLRQELWFAAVLVQKGYVGFYFMPVHDAAEKKAIFKPELLKCLKGKSCFHIKKSDPVILQQIEESLAKGYRNHKEKGWL